MPARLAVHLRRLTPQDAPAYRRLMLHAYAAHPEAFTSSARERAAAALSVWQARLAPLPSNPEALWGAWRDHELLGALGLRLETGERTRHKAELFGMVVQPLERRQGLGRRLLAAVLEDARLCPGLRVLRLSVSASNSAALALYESAGFQRWGTEPQAVRWGDGYIDKHQMALHLPDDQARWLLADSELAQIGPLPHADADAAPDVKAATPPALRLKFSAAHIQRQWPGERPQTGYLPGLMLDVWPDETAQPMAGNPLAGRIRAGHLWVAGQARPNMPSVPLPAPAAWETWPASAAPMRLELEMAQGGSLQLALRALHVHWPPGVRWQESLAC